MKKIISLKQLLIMICCLQLATSHFLSADDIDAQTMKAISDALISGWKLSASGSNTQTLIAAAIDDFGRIQSTLTAQKAAQIAAEKTIADLNQKLAQAQADLRNARAASTDVAKAQAETQQAVAERDNTRRELEALQATNTSLRTKIGLIQA